jgi:stearoyl-CoA desaturase (Delta-9 desaturase)
VSTTSAIALWVLCSAALGLGNTAGYHRLFTHRAFKAAAPVRVALAIAGALHSGPPLLWIGLHRYHHLRSETPEDPHSPRNGGQLYAHTGWLLGRSLGRPVSGPPVASAASLLFALSGFGQQVSTLVHDLRRVRGTNPPEWLSLCKDLSDVWELQLLERPFVTTGLFVAQLGACWAVGGAWGILWLWALHFALTNGSWAVNSLCHNPRLGRAPYDTGEDSRDVPWLAPLTWGESYHNAHHRYPRSACHGLDGGFDPTWWVIRLLVAVGLASDPWLPKKARSA